MWRQVCLAVAVILGSQAARADNVAGSSALALAGLTAPYDRALGPAQRYYVARLFAGSVDFPYPHGKSITVRAAMISCRISNVAIAARSCVLTVGGRSVNLSGRLANELYATIAVAGVAPDGGMGSIYEALKGLDCTLTPSVIRENAGGGASCVFTAGP